MSPRAPDGHHEARADTAYATAWWTGELSDMEVWLSVSGYVAKLKNQNTARVFQGTAGGSPAVYVFHKQ